MAGLTAEQIIERIANANGVEPEVMRQQIERPFRILLMTLPNPILLC